MTEIKIEKKAAIWPWLLLILALIAAAWFFFFRNDKIEPEENVKTVALIDVRENNSVVASYVAFVESDTNTMGLDHAYSSQALSLLTNAIDAMALEADYVVKVDIDQAKIYANDITKDSLSTHHADKIRTSADLLSTTLQNLQQAKFPTLSAEAADVKIAASSIDPEKLTLDQRDAVKSFFRKSADLLNKMN